VRHIVIFIVVSASHAASLWSCTERLSGEQWLGPKHKLAEDGNPTDDICIHITWSFIKTRPITLEAQGCNCHWGYKTEQE
jgi:hypothetical protein